MSSFLKVCCYKFLIPEEVNFELISDQYHAYYI